MESNSFLEIIFMVFGSIMLGASIFNWDYFFKQRKAQILIRYTGIVGARLIYGVLGSFFIVFGANYFFKIGWF